MLTDSQQPELFAADATVEEQFRAVDRLAGAVRRIQDRIGRHRAVLATIVSSFGIFGLTAVQGILLARLLGPEGRGQYATGIFYTQTLLYVGLLGALVAIARRAARQDRPVAELRSAALRLGFCTGLGTAAVVSVLAIVALPEGKQGLAPLCIGCSLLLPVEQMRLALLSVDHGSAAFKRYNAIRLFAAGLFPLLLLAAWLSGLMSVTVAVLLTIVASLIGLFVHIVAVGGAAGFQRSSLTARTLIAEGLPFAPGIIVGNLFSRIDVFLILWLASLTVQGLYAAAVPAAWLLTVAAAALELFAFNAGARSDNGISSKRLARLAASIVALQLAMFIGFSLVLEPLMLFVYGPRFLDAIPLTRALLPAYALRGCTMVADGYLSGRGKAAISVWSRAVGATVLFSLVAIGFRRWGPISIPWATVAGDGTVLLCVAGAIWNGSRSEAPPPADVSSAIEWEGIV